MGPGRHGRGTGATEAFPRMGSPRRRIARHPPDRRCGHALSTGLRRRQSPSSGGGRCPPTFPRMAGHGGAPSSRPAILRVPAGGSPPVMRSRMSLDISARRSGSLRPRRTFIGSAADPPPNLRTIRRGNLVPRRPGPRMRGMFVGLGRALVEYRPYRRRSSPVRRFPYPRRPGRNSAIRLRPVIRRAVFAHFRRSGSESAPENAARILRHPLSRVLPRSDRAAPDAMTGTLPRADRRTPIRHQNPMDEHHEPDGHTPVSFGRRRRLTCRNGDASGNVMAPSRTRMAVSVS